MGPLSTIAVLKPWSTAVEATIIPEPEPITRTSNRSITKLLDALKKKRMPNKPFNSRFRVPKGWKIFYGVLKNNNPVIVMSKAKKAEEEKKKKIYYEKKEKKAKEVKK
jgi:hypothetical protein